MSDVLFWCAVALAILIGIFVVIAVIGSFFARYHQVTRSMEFHREPDEVWKVITDIANIPEWHRGVAKVERLENRGEHEVWRETYQGGYGVTLETSERDAPNRLVRHITDDKGPFTGRWEFDLKPTEAGCRLSITEFGDVANPFFRFMARLFMNPAAYLEIYLRELARKFGQKPVIEKVNPTQ